MSELSTENPSVAENIKLIEDVKFFLATAPANWQASQVIRRYYLNQDEGFVSCVFWNNLFFITGTDIVRCIVYRFQLFGREILDRKKFEEGIFSDLRSLKCGSNAILENSKSEFLTFLYKNSCLRTQKKQKVFFWYSVPHDTLFADALERDLKKESNGGIGTTKAIQEPALSFVFDEKSGLSEQLNAYVEDQRKKIQDSDSGSEEEEEEEEETNSKKPTTFIITEQNNTPIVQESNYDDDFPLDYFPQDENILFDPQVFFNPPSENYYDSLLIDQTYTKTPHKDSAFGDRLIQKEEIEFDDLESANPYYLQPPSARTSHFLYQPYIPQQSYPQITNAQYYDGQLSGQPIDLPNYPNDFIQPQSQPFIDPYMAQPVVDPQYLYPQYEFDQDESFENPYNMRMVSPFTNYFPSFEAMNPPKSTKRPKYNLKSIKNTRISKPSAKNAPAVSSKLTKIINNSNEKSYESLPTPESTSLQ